VSMIAKKRIGSLALPLFVALAMASCARFVTQGGEGVGGGRGGGDPQPCGTQVIEPTPGMADVHARPFDDATVADDDVTVRIDFVSGVEPCFVLDDVDVRYGIDTVTITLFEGHDPSPGNVACIDIGVFKRVVVTLDQPLAGRAIVDGAAA
jgi:hypothetical protein